VKKARCKCGRYGKQISQGVVNLFHCSRCRDYFIPGAPKEDVEGYLSTFEISGNETLLNEERRTN
jgi:hypothetical protein